MNSKKHDSALPDLEPMKRQIYNTNDKIICSKIDGFLLTPGHNKISSFLSTISKESSKIILTEGKYYEDNDIYPGEIKLVGMPMAKIILRNNSRIIFGKQLTGFLITGSIKYSTNFLIYRDDEIYTTPNKRADSPLPKTTLINILTNDIKYYIEIHNQLYKINKVENNKIYLDEKYMGRSIDQEEFHIYQFSNKKITIKNISIINSTIDNSSFESGFNENNNQTESNSTSTIIGKRKRNIAIQVNNCFNFWMKNVSIDNFQINLELNSVYKSVIESCRFTGNIGVKANYSNDLFLNQTTFRNCSKIGLYIIGNSKSKHLLSNCIISNNELGAKIEGSGLLKIESGEVSGNNSGGIMMRGVRLNVKIDSVNILDNENWGIDCQTTGLIEIDRSTIKDNISGITLNNSGPSEVSNCQIINNKQVGLEIKNLGVKVFHNLINSNQIGIKTNASSIITNNRLIGNSDKAVMVESNDVTINDNDFYHNNYAIKIVGNFNFITNNISKEDTYGIFIEGDSNIITGGTFTESKDAITIESGFENRLIDVKAINISGKRIVNHGTETIIVYPSASRK